MDTMEDVKPPINTQYVFIQDAETKVSSPVNGFKDLPMKTGEVFRSSEGCYSFMCFNCGLIFDDLSEIVNHCESHYQDEKNDVFVQPSEFVLCAEPAEPQLIHIVTDPPETTSIIASSEAVVRRRKRKIQTSKSLPTKTTSMTPSKKSKPKVDRKLSEESSSLTVKSKSKATARRIKIDRKLENIPQNCPICEVWCDDFRDHMKQAHNLLHRIFQCYICKKFSKNLTLLKAHISTRNHNTNSCYHCAMEPPINHPTEARRHKCLFCKEWYPNHAEFKVHFKDAHHQNADHFFSKRANCNIFTCYICEREFPLRYYLHAHMRIHYDKFLRHQCPTCGRRLRTYGQLTQHLKTHEGKTFSCDQCDKQFAYYARLRLHRASHNTELNFKCDQCPKKFKQRKYLLTHKALHTNERKYACKFCDATFNFTSGRRAHEKGRHGAL